MLLPLGFLGTFLLNNFLKETYSSRKLELEESIENLLDKNVDLGDYVGIRFLGISLGDSKINKIIVKIGAGPPPTTTQLNASRLWFRKYC